MSRFALFCLCLCAFFGSHLALAASYDGALAQLQKQWALIKYQMPDHDQQKDAILMLRRDARELSKTYPNKADPMIWEAIIDSTKAEIDSNFGSLLLIQHARDLLLQADKINPKALHGLGAATLGSLYCLAPKPPLSFGDMDMGKEYMEKAVLQNPNGLDVNFLYGKCLHEMGDDTKAKKVLTKALAAPIQNNNLVADEGRRAEVQEVLGEIDSQDYPPSRN